MIQLSDTKYAKVKKTIKTDREQIDKRLDEFWKTVKGMKISQDKKIELIDRCLDDVGM